MKPSKTLAAVSAITVAHPVGTENVDSDMGQNTVAASGSISFDHDLFSLEGVYGTIYTGAVPGDNDYQNYQQAQNIDPGTGDFSFPTLLNAACNSAGTQSNNYKIWCVLMDKDTTQMLPVTTIGTFTGRCVTLAARAKAKSVAAATSLPGLPLDYHRKLGKWRQYRNVAVSHPHEGTLLLNNGKLLLASSISIAAERVLWRTRDELGGPWIGIDKAKGRATNAPNNNTWRFNGLNKYAVTVWQIGGFTKVVTSESPLAPGVVTGLNSNSPIFVQVNDLARTFSDNFGAFDLWVRVEST